jgi:hypothetical protein
MGMVSPGPPRTKQLAQAVGLGHPSRSLTWDRLLELSNTGACLDTMVKKKVEIALCLAVFVARDREGYGNP